MLDLALSLDKELGEAVRIAHTASAILRDARVSALDVKRKQDDSIVTEADLASDESLARKARIWSEKAVEHGSLIPWTGRAAILKVETTMPFTLAWSVVGKLFSVWSLNLKQSVSIEHSRVLERS
jgi:hypothetical protein